MNRLPCDRLVHIGVVVRDLHASARHYAQVYGIRHWNVVRHDAARLSETSTRGFRTEQAFCTATATVQTQAGDVTFRLIQPTGGWTGYHEFLNTRGEGIHHVCSATLSTAQFEELSPWLKSQDISISESFTLDGQYRFVMLDTREALGGFQIQLLVTDADPAEIAIDERWDLKDAISESGGLVPIGTPRLHFGVVVHDLMARIEQWRRLFDLPKAEFMLWQSGVEGSLDAPQNMGKPVEHGYFTSIITLAPGLCFEVIQPTYGPSHYKEQFLHLVGEGIHHMYLARLDSEAACTAVCGRSVAAGIPVVMGGGVGGGLANFYYLDTAAKVGFVTELTHPGPAFTAGAMIRPVMTADFSQPVQA